MSRTTVSSWTDGPRRQTRGTRVGVVANSGDPGRDTTHTPSSRTGFRRAPRTRRPSIPGRARPRQESTPVMKYIPVLETDRTVDPSTPRPCVGLRRVTPGTVGVFDPYSLHSTSPTGCRVTVSPHSKIRVPRKLSMCPVHGGVSGCGIALYGPVCVSEVRVLSRPL